MALTRTPFLSCTIKEARSDGAQAHGVEATFCWARTVFGRPQKARTARKQKLLTRRNTGKMDLASSEFILPPSSRESDENLKAGDSRIELLPVELLPISIDVLPMKMFRGN